MLQNNIFYNIEILCRKSLFHQPLCTLDHNKYFEHKKVGGSKVFHFPFSFIVTSLCYIKAHAKGERASLLDTVVVYN